MNTGERVDRYWTLSGTSLGPMPQVADFELREGSIPVPRRGQALTRTIYISLDPYQWLYKKQGIDRPGAVCHARTVAQVIESRMAGFAPGDFVFNTNGWREYGLMGEGIERPSYMNPRKLDPNAARISQAVGVLGMLGLTAYAGMLLQCSPRHGETAVVSAASGGVGQIAAQLARLHGARVVGIAGREEKQRYVVEELGLDECVSHLSATFAQDLKAACPNGIDVYFENVGGHVFDAIASLFNAGARMSLCGVISQYTEDRPQETKGALLERSKLELEKRGVCVHELFVGDFVAEHQERFLRDMSAWVASGKIKYREDIRQGIETVPQAFVEMMRGDNFGKTLVQVSPDPTLA